MELTLFNHSPLKIKSAATPSASGTNKDMAALP